MNNILIIGCGLLGSSLLRRIHKKKIVKKIFIYEKSKSNISKIKKLRLPGIVIDKLDKRVINYDLIIATKKITMPIIPPSIPPTKERIEFMKTTLSNAMEVT